MDGRHLLLRPTRRDLVLTLGALGIGAIVPGCESNGRSSARAGASAGGSTVRPASYRTGADPQPGGPGDMDAKIFTFALNLEYMEAEYYSRGASGRGLDEQDVDCGRNPGPVSGGRKVRFSRQSFQDYADELAFNETAHVKFYRKTLGESAVDRPTIDFEAGFNKAAQAAGLVKEGETFDPFANEINFFLGGMLFEDTGVTAYRGAVKLLSNQDSVSAAAGVLAVEAYHMGMVRSLLYEAGEEARKMANAVSDARDKLDGGKDLDQGIEVDGKANIVPSDDRGICFERTPRQVLNIVYLKPDATRGGFYPNGFNGDFSGLL
jgi:hypothetical protein